MRYASCINILVINLEQGGILPMDAKKSSARRQLATGAGSYESEPWLPPAMRNGAGGGAQPFVVIRTDEPWSPPGAKAAPAPKAAAPVPVLPQSVAIQSDEPWSPAGAGQAMTVVETTKPVVETTVEKVVVEKRADDGQSGYDYTIVTTTKKTRTVETIVEETVRTETKKLEA
jgi:hypothetical protein